MGLIGARVVVESRHSFQPGAVVVLALPTRTTAKDAPQTYVAALVLNEEELTSSLASATVGLAQLAQLQDLRRMIYGRKEDKL